MLDIVPAVVTGTVRTADGTPLVMRSVRAFDKSLRSEKQVGAAETDQTGHYVIQYSPGDSCGEIKAKADLIIRVFDATGAVVVESPLIINARPDENVDLVVGGGVYRGPSEYEQLRLQLSPFWACAPPEQWSESDLAYISGKSGIGAHDLRLLVDAAIRAGATKLPVEIHYALARAGLTGDLVHHAAEN